MTNVPAPSDVPAGREPTVPIRLLAVGDIIGGSFRTLMRSPKIFIGMPLIACAAIAIPALAIALLAVGGARATDGNGGRGIVVAVAVLGGLTLGVLAVYVLARVIGAVTIGAYRIALGEDPAIGQVWREARGIVWRLIAFMLLMSAAVLVTFFVVTFAVFAAGNFDSSAAAILVLLLLVAAFPTVLFLSVKLIYCLQSMAIEHADPVGAIRHSWNLTRGFWWPTLGRLLMLYLLGIPVSIVAQGLTIAPMGGLTRTDGTLNMAGLSALMIITFLVAIALNFLYQAFSQIYVTIMYLDARRREGVAAQPPSGYPYAGGPAYLQTPPGAAYGAALGYGAPTGYGAAATGYATAAGSGAPGVTTGTNSAASATGADPYPSATPPPPTYPAAGTGGEPYPPAGPLWSHTPTTGYADATMSTPALTEPMPTYDSGSGSGSSYDSGSGSAGDSGSGSPGDSGTSGGSGTDGAPAGAD